MTSGPRTLRRNASLVTIVTAIVGTTLGLAATPAAASLLPIPLPVTLCPPLPASVCDTLGGGGGGGGTPSLPTGVATAIPTSFSNTGTAQAVTITDPLGTIYSTLTSGVVVQLVGTGAAAAETVPGTVGTISGTSIPVTFNLDSTGVPVSPGAYSMHITPANTSSTGLTTLLSGLGLSSLPVDTVNVTVTAGKPTPTAQLSLAPGGTVAASITTSTTPFAQGDAVSFTASDGSAVPGLSLQSPQLSATAITGQLSAGPSVTPGQYNVVVTDTSGQTGSCAGCVTVTSSKATSLALSLSHSVLSAGKSVTLSGHLLSGGSGVGSGAVYLLSKTVGGKVQVLKLVHSASNGFFSYTFTPMQNAVYAAYFEGGVTPLGIDLPSLSNIAKLSVAPRLTLKVVAHRLKGLSHGARLILTGRVTPHLPGKVTVYNHGKRFGTAKVASNGTYRFVKKVLKRGHYALRVRTAKLPVLAAGSSPTRRTTVH